MKVTAAQLEAISKDSTWTNIGALPSQFIPYKNRGDKSMEVLYVKPLSIAELLLISKTASLGNINHMLRAVDNCITHDVMDLTIGDFYYVLLWLRTYSTTKTPYVVEWFCDQPIFQHNETKQFLLYDNKDWPTMDVLSQQYTSSPCNTQNTSSVHAGDPEVLCLDDDLVLPEGFDFPRVAIMEDMNKAISDPEQQFLVPAVQWLVGNTWQEKLESAKDLNRFYDAIELNKVITHGVKETVKVTCLRCRVSHDQPLVLNAAGFFQ